MSNKDIQNILDSADLAIKKSNDAIKKSHTLLESLKKRYNDTLMKTEKVQEKIDGEIVKIVQKMDEETLAFVKATE